VADAVVTAIETTLTGVSQIVGTLVRSPLVAVSTTRAAALASGALAVHALTKGAAAARIVRAIPATMTLVVWATNPWKLLMMVSGVMAAAMAFAAFRLGRTPTPTEPTPDWDVIDGDVVDWNPRDTSASDEEIVDASLREAAFVGADQPRTATQSEELELSRDTEAACTAPNSHADSGSQGVLHTPVAELGLGMTATGDTDPTSVSGDAALTSDGVTSLAASLKVVIAVDGSIEVHGIPASLPEDEQRRIAQTAADAAAQQLRRIARRGRPLRSADRRHVTKAAQAAVRASVDPHAAAA